VHGAFCQAITNAAKLQIIY